MLRIHQVARPIAQNQEVAYWTSLEDLPKIQAKHLKTRVAYTLLQTHSKGNFHSFWPQVAYLPRLTWKIKIAWSAEGFQLSRPDLAQWFFKEPWSNLSLCSPLLPSLPDRAFLWQVSFLERRNLCHPPRSYVWHKFAFLCWDYSLKILLDNYVCGLEPPPQPTELDEPEPKAAPGEENTLPDQPRPESASYQTPQVIPLPVAN